MSDTSYGRIGFSVPSYTPRRKSSHPPHTHLCDFSTGASLSWKDRVPCSFVHTTEEKTTDTHRPRWSHLTHHLDPAWAIFWAPESHCQPEGVVQFSLTEPLSTAVASLRGSTMSLCCTNTPSDTDWRRLLAVTYQCSSNALICPDKYRMP